MKSPLLVALIVFISCLSPVLAETAADPSDKFLEAYFLIQEADALERQENWAQAHAKFSAALEKLKAIKAQDPEWNPHVINFRVRYCTEHIEALTPKLPATPVTPTVEPTPDTPPVTPTTPSDEADTIQKLKAELRLSRDQLRQLEAAREEINAKLQEALQKGAESETNIRVKELLKKNNELNQQLDVAQKQINDLRKQALVKPAPAEPAELKRLRAELTAAKTALQQEKQTGSLVERLTRENKNLSAQLADTRKQILEMKRPAPTAEAAQVQKLTADLGQAKDQILKLEASRAALDTELQRAKKAELRLTELVKQNSDLNSQLHSAQRQIADLKRQPRPSQGTLPDESVELQQLRSELTAAKNTLEKVKNESAVVESLSAQNKTLSAQLAGAQQEIASLKKQAATKSTPSTESAQMQQIRSELQSTKQQLAQTKQQLEAVSAKGEPRGTVAGTITGPTDPAVAKLQIALNEANKKLQSVMVANKQDDELIRQLRSENELLRKIAETKAITPRKTDDYTGPVIPELKGWRPRNWPRPAQAAR